MSTVGKHKVGILHTFSMSNEIVISPATISKYAGKRYHIEIPANMTKIIEDLKGQPVVVTIKPLARYSSK